MFSSHNASPSRPDRIDEASVLRTSSWRPPSALWSALIAGVAVAVVLDSRLVTRVLGGRTS